MLNLDSLLKKLRLHWYSEAKNYIDLIVEQNSRVENYFSVLLLSLLEQLKLNGDITDYKFQYLLSSPSHKRNHIDFLIIGKGFKVCLEIKHLAIDTEKKLKNNRSINFYTSISEQGKKVGIVGDIEKLNNTNNNTITDFISFSVITNPPDRSILNDRIEYLRKQGILKKWKIEEYNSDSEKLSFIVCSQSLKKLG